MGPLRRRNFRTATVEAMGARGREKLPLAPNTHGGLPLAPRLGPRLEARGREHPSRPGEGWIVLLLS